MELFWDQCKTRLTSLLTWFHRHYLFVQFTHVVTAKYVNDMNTVNRNRLNIKKKRIRHGKFPNLMSWKPTAISIRINFFSPFECFLYYCLSIYRFSTGNKNFIADQTLIEWKITEVNRHLMKIESKNFTFQWFCLRDECNRIWV